MTKAKLPFPLSPTELDDKILAYAQRKVPARRAYRPPLWLSGLATASIIGVAVLLAIPEQSEILAPTALPELAAPAKAKTRRILQTQREEAMTVSADALSAFPATENVMDSATTSDEMLAVQLTSEDLRQQLEQLSALVSNGKTEQAETAYDELKRRCKDCALPATLEQALADYLGGN